MVDFGDLRDFALVPPVLVGHRRQRERSIPVEGWASGYGSGPDSLDNHQPSVYLRPRLPIYLIPRLRRLCQIDDLGRFQ